MPKTTRMSLYSGLSLPSYSYALESQTAVKRIETCNKHERIANTTLTEKACGGRWHKGCPHLHGVQKREKPNIMLFRDVSDKITKTSKGPINPEAEGAISVERRGKVDEIGEGCSGNP